MPGGNVAGENEGSGVAASVVCHSQQRTAVQTQIIIIIIRDGQKRRDRAREKTVRLCGYGICALPHVAL